MSNIDDIRSKFYDDSDPFALDSTTGGGSSSSTAGVGPSRSSASGSSTAVATSSSRPAPYPNRTSRGKGKQRRGGDASSSTAWGSNDDTAVFDHGRDDNDNAGDGGAGGFDYGLGLRTQDIADVDMELGERAREGVMRREEEESDVQKLLRCWRNERHAPDILPTKDQLLGDILDSIRRQTNDVNALRAAEDLTEEDHYMMMLVQTEVERMKFVVRSYVRARLYKIERFAAYILSEDNKAEMHPRLTEAELRHAQQYGALLTRHFDATVLNHLPPSQRSMDDEVPMVPSMITEPNKDKPVFVHALENCGQVRLPDGTGYHVQKGSIHLMRYRTIEHLLLRDEIELV